MLKFSHCAKDDLSWCMKIRVQNQTLYHYISFVPIHSIVLCSCFSFFLNVVGISLNYNINNRIADASTDVVADILIPWCPFVINLPILNSLLSCPLHFMSTIHQSSSDLLQITIVRSIVNLLFGFAWGPSYQRSGKGKQTDGHMSQIIFQIKLVLCCYSCNEIISIAKCLFVCRLLT